MNCILFCPADSPKSDIKIFTISIGIPPPVPLKSFWPLCAVEGISPVLTDPERARRMEVRRGILKAQAWHLRSENAEHRN